MSRPQPIPLVPDCPHATDQLRSQLHQRLDHIIDTCLHDHAGSSFLALETALLVLLRSLGQLLVQLFLLARHRRLDLGPWLQGDRYRQAADYAPRTLETSCGPVTYGRIYLIPLHGPGPGVHPLDAELGLTRDSFSPLVIGWFCRLATRLSFRLASEMGGMFLGWAPAVATIEEWVLGLGRPAYVYLTSGPLPEDDGEVLVIECDGKAAPTATAEELAQRRGPQRRHGKACSCGCQRHRGRTRRHRRGRKKRRNKGDKSKNGKSATLVVLYTPRRGEDGRLHGPINKKVFGTFSSRPKALKWAREQATRRGFPPETQKTVQVVFDGEECLEKRMRLLFPQAILTLESATPRRSCGWPDASSPRRAAANCGRGWSRWRGCSTRAGWRSCCGGWTGNWAGSAVAAREPRGSGRRWGG